MIDHLRYESRDNHVCPSWRRCANVWVYWYHFTSVGIRTDTDAQNSSPG
jgi:hypothetical protein